MYINGGQPQKISFLTLHSLLKRSGLDEFSAVELCAIEVRNIHKELLYQHSIFRRKHTSES